MFHEETAWELHGLHCSDCDLITVSGRVFSPKQEIAISSPNNARVRRACIIG
jgi:hypothetical protein